MMPGRVLCTGARNDDTWTLARVSVVPTELGEFSHTSDLRAVV